jgi:hypothetical protein
MGLWSHIRGALLHAISGMFDVGISVRRLQAFLRRTSTEIVTMRIHSGACAVIVTVVLASCASYGPYHANTPEKPNNSIRGPQDERYKMAFIEFGDQGSPLDNYQRKAALEMIHKAERPLLFVYIHGWQNNATSRDVCRFEHFLDTVSDLPEFKVRKSNVLGVYIAWRGKDLTVPGLNFFTFWSRKSAGEGIAAANSCLSTIQELAVAAREPGKSYHRTVLLGHSFGALVLGNTISHSILGSSSPWDMAVAFNSAASSVNTRQLMQEFDYLYKYDGQRHAYISRSNLGGTEARAIAENRPAIVFLQAENDTATGLAFPMGQEFYNAVNLRLHWQKVPVPGHHGDKVSEREFYTHTPGNSKYLVNYQVVPLGETRPPSDVRKMQNRAFEANVTRNHPDYSFYTSEQNDGHEQKFCPTGEYDSSEIRPPTEKEVWRRWKFEYTGNARVPCWIVRVPKDIISGHGGLWSDNSVAMLGALFRIEFPLVKDDVADNSSTNTALHSPDLQR